MSEVRATAPDEERVSLVRQAVREVPREAFESEAGGTDAVGHSCPSSGAVEALMLAAQLQPGDHVLQIGTGSGYLAAAISRLAESVISIERLLPLVELARTRCESLGYSNVEVRHDNGRYGFPQCSPYDVILISASGIEAPPTLLRQLKPGGRLVTVRGDKRTNQTLQRVTCVAPDRYESEELGSCPVARDIEALMEDLRAKSEVIASIGSDDVCSPERTELRSSAAERGLACMALDEIADDLDIDVFEAVPRAFLQHNQMIPIDRRGNLVRILSCNPDARVEAIGGAFPGCSIELILVTPSDFRLMWTTCELRAAEVHVFSSVRDAATRDLEEDPHELDAHFVKLFETLLVDAVRRRASDIHLERYRSEVRVRLRIDGELVDNRRLHLSSTEVVGLINVIKIRANMNIAERRLPQGGRIYTRIHRVPYDLRVQTQPSLHGEQAVLRLLPQTGQLRSIGDLGFSLDMAATYSRLLQVPSGMLLVVGPTGSGKSTTLYAGLKMLAEDNNRKVITVEDPIEYSVFGIQQTQVQPSIGFHFADAMRSFVRLDPDVILLGEIRDPETALEAIRASQTGHLVLSTLHSNDTTDAVQRLLDLRMHPNSIGSELLAVISQRLSKRICPNCRARVEPDGDLLSEVFPDGAAQSFRCFAGRGCDECEGTGTHGRIAVYELLRASPALRSAISSGAGVDELRGIADRAGLISLRSSLLEHVVTGRVPFSEARRLLPIERIAGPAHAFDEGPASRENELPLRALPT